MEEMAKLIEGVSVADARAAFYYLGRYLKQAGHYNRYGKDFFEDNDYSEPSEIGKELTFKLIDFIESSENKKARNFSDKEYLYWTDRIAQIESNLDPELTQEQIDSAKAVMEGIRPPTLGRND
ncbi:hypothetical protein [Massilia timonae]|uniref:hypothetical protein n=1 Tax=Massilia timonae TaxID=47229 RepID=UPI00289E84BC|nr:hypothetical protein [Massilia timonae]